MKHLFPNTFSAIHILQNINNITRNLFPNRLIIYYKSVVKIYRSAAKKKLFSIIFFKKQAKQENITSSSSKGQMYINGFNKAPPHTNYTNF